ncbi:ExbD/TolR family protein [Thermodesulfobacteriota bacterium]
MNPFVLNIPKSRPGKPHIGLTPLVDVVFLLLIFFMVTTVFPEQTGMKIEKPESEHTARLGQKKIVVAVDRTGVIYHRNRVVTIDELKQQLTEALLVHPDNMVLIKADRRTTTESLIRVMDVGKSSGAKQIGIATHDKVDEQ